MSDIKRELHNQCVRYVQSRVDTVMQAIKSAQQAANDETKSSAGDKYETGRAMMQQDTDRNQAQLNEANKLLVILNRLGINRTASIVEAGSLVLTDNGNFYLAVSAGNLTFKGEVYFAISPASPIGLQLQGKKAGDSFILNGRTYIIKSVL